MYVCKIPKFEGMYFSLGSTNHNNNIFSDQRSTECFGAFVEVLSSDLSQQNERLP